jgi:hypothetical protein
LLPSDFIWFHASSFIHIFVYYLIITGNNDGCHEFSPRVCAKLYSQSVWRRDAIRGQRGEREVLLQNVCGHTGPRMTALSAYSLVLERGAFYRLMRNICCFCSAETREIAESLVPFLEFEID